ncbi:MAG: hypothetical protein ACR2LV_05135 [Solirubrobacteraceae bacterium]
MAAETGRPLGELPSELSVSVITLAELELGVLRATDSTARARRLATLARVRSQVPAVTQDNDFDAFSSVHVIRV